MEEKWRPIRGYEGLYEVSDMGNVRSLKRHTTNGKMLKPLLTKDGYMSVCLCKGNKKKTFRVHRLVAREFIKNDDPEIKIVVNHKNEIKTDNKASNLEWCTIKYNTNYNSMTYRRQQYRRKKVKAIKGSEVIFFESITSAASELGVSHGNISECLAKRKGRKSLKGYRFEYI